jgi:GDPmannose 4,6-dehydratase
MVHGIKRRSSSFNTQRIDHMYNDIHERKKKLILHYGDLTDSLSLIHIIKKIKPIEIYNLAAQSHVAVSFEEPEFTANSDALGTLRILEAIRILGLQKKIKFYQASTSELYGKVAEIPQCEKTTFNPRSPYAVAKLYSYWITKTYREAYGIHASNGILFNHESPRRGETFVTRKVTRGLCRIFLGLENKIFMGNLNAKRDWGHAKDYVEAQWRIMQLKQPVDLVIATGIQKSVRQLINLSAKYLGMKLLWKGKNENEKVHWNNKIIIEIDRKYYRAAEVENLLGNPKKAKKILKWKPKISFETMIKEMVQNDLNEAKRDLIIKEHGYKFFSKKK